jgi:hypothetical protein
METSVYYHVDKSPLLVYIQSQMDPAHILISCFFNIQFNIVLPSTRKSFKWSLLGFPPNFVCIYYLFHACYMSHHQIPLIWSS